MQRRSILLALGAATPEPEMLLLRKNGWMPNNERLPVLLYRRLFMQERELTEKLEALVAKNGWEPQWRNGVYPFHHYHSTAHEVLAFSKGEAKLILGGEGGTEIVVRAGDLAVLPCGTGHCRVTATRDFQVSGAYALGQSWDLLREAPDAAAVERMRRLPFPPRDPVAGAARWRY
jgi:uncharacterized protein YjlB